MTAQFRHRVLDRPSARAIALGAAGGCVFWLLSLPAPWLTGSLLFVAVAAIAGIGVRSPDWARFFLFVVLGTSIGASLSPRAVLGMIDWPASLAVYAVCVCVMVWLGQIYLVRVARCDRGTALFTAIPGTLSLVLPLAGSAGADVRQVALIQSVRLIALVVVFPVSAGSFHLLGTRAAEAAPVAMGGTPWPLIELFAAALVAALVAQRLKAPAAPLVGALAASGLLHATGLVAVAPPSWLVSAALVTLGVMIGTRFVGSEARVLLRLAGIGGGMVLMSLAVSAAFAFMAHLVLGFGFGELLLAYAPGGIDAMTLIALSLGLDPAFVGAHHLARMVIMSVVLPLIAKRYARPRT